MSESFFAELPQPDATDRLGCALALALKSLTARVNAQGAAIRLEGDLGAGKTSLVRAMLRKLGWQGAVKSPTFTLLESYEVARLTIHHFDFYRFESPEEFEDAGFSELYAAGAVCLSEWSSRAQPCLPAADIVVELSQSGLGRKASIRSESDIGREIVNAWETQWNAAA